MPNISGHRAAVNADGYREARSAPPDIAVEDSLLRAHSKLYQRRKEIEAELRRELNMDDPPGMPLPRPNRGDGAAPFGRPPPVPKPRQRNSRLPPIPKVDADDVPRRRWGDMDGESSARSPQSEANSAVDDRWWRKEQEELQARKHWRQEEDQVAPGSPTNNSAPSSPQRRGARLPMPPPPIPVPGAAAPARERPQSWRQPRSARGASQDPTPSPTPSAQDTPQSSARGSPKNADEPWRLKARELEEIARQHRKNHEENARRREAVRAEREAQEAEAARMSEEQERRRAAAEARAQEAKMREEQRLEEIRREEERRRQKESEEAKKRRQEQEEWEREMRYKLAEEERARREASKKDQQQEAERQREHLDELGRQYQQREERKRQEHQREDREQARRQAEQRWRQARSEDARADAEAERFRKRREENAGVGSPKEERQQRKEEEEAKRKEEEEAKRKEEEEREQRERAERRREAKEEWRSRPREDGAWRRNRYRGRGGEASPEHRGFNRSQSLPAVGRRKDSEQLEAAKSAALQQLRALRQMPSKEERQKGFKDLLRAWHPDKNPQNQEVATAVFQLLQVERNRIINGKD